MNNTIILEAIAAFGLSLAAAFAQMPAAGHFTEVNGLKMYYEIEGAGYPLVYIPPAFGFAGMKSFPALTQNHSVITVDLQGHGRTADIPERPLSIEQYAKDVLALLNYLGIQKADFFGESYGANTAIMIAVNYPELVGRVNVGTRVDLVVVPALEYKELF